MSAPGAVGARLPKPTALLRRRQVRVLLAEAAERMAEAAGADAIGIEILDDVVLVYWMYFQEADPNSQGTFSALILASLLRKSHGKHWGWRWYGVDLPFGDHATSSLIGEAGRDRLFGRAGDDRVVGPRRQRLAVRRGRQRLIAA